MKNVDKPAVPTTVHSSTIAIEQSRAMYGVIPEPTYYRGLSKREQFCLTMGVPLTGDNELDAIIIEGNRIKFAAMAMQGYLACKSNTTASHAAGISVLLSGQLLKALEEAK